MIGFIVTSLQLQSIMTAHKWRLSTTRFIPYWTVSSLPVWLTWFWFTNRSLHLLRLPWTTTVLWIRRSSQNQGQRYVTTDGRSASLSWYKARMWGLRPDLYFCRSILHGSLYSPTCILGNCLSLWRIHGNCFLIRKARSVPSQSPRIRIYVEHMLASRCLAVDYFGFWASCHNNVWLLFLYLVS
jgi:hypothetical protein